MYALDSMFFLKVGIIVHSYKAQRESISVALQLFFSECDDESPSIEVLVRSPSLPIHSTSNHGSPSLWAIVMRMQNEIKTLKLDVKHLQIQLLEEKQDRTLTALHSKNNFMDARESKC